MALTRTPDPNRSTAINVIHVKVRSPYIVDWRMVVVEGGHVLPHAKREEELSGREKCPGREYVDGEMSESRST